MKEKLRKEILEINLAITKAVINNNTVEASNLTLLLNIKIDEALKIWHKRLMSK